jgi:hypothetical protein
MKNPLGNAIADATFDRGGDSGSGRSESPVITSPRCGFNFSDHSVNCTRLIPQPEAAHGKTKGR